MSSQESVAFKARPSIIARFVGAISDREPLVQPPSRSKARCADSSGSLLSAPQFKSFLERERSLADRGTRRFSLLALSRRAGGPEQRRERDALAQLARQACKRLRSTDLVGLLSADRVEILLVDTEPAGARLVVIWIEQAEARLGLALEHMLYVYPTVAEPVSSDPRDDDPRPGGPLNGKGPRRGRRETPRPTRRRGAAATTGVAPIAVETLATNGNLNGHATPAATVETSGVVPAYPHPVRDLWPLLAVPTPLWKRSVDILLSGLALLVLLPLFLLIAIAIRLDSPGPVSFRQLRAGQGARPFMFYKFRSMTADAEQRRAALTDQNEQDGPIFKIHDDPRITRVGRLLRRGSMDELPQLLNVLKGDISLVGPRSPTMNEVGLYERWQRRRLGVIGGITCTWQVSGRNQIRFQEWMRLDLRYVARRGPWLDLRLLALTIPAVLSGRGAC
jgi:lipopolysaccharide/colanic/teichoic acid biosynthesis glycosyltransferase